MKEKIQRTVSIQNRRARFDYELLDTYTAGMVLVGTEIKSLRLGKASLVDAFCYFHNGELWLKGANISEYFYGSYNNHAARRDRKLLLNRKELRKLEAYVQSPGVTIVPVKIFINDRGLAKGRHCPPLEGRRSMTSAPRCVSVMTAVRWTAL